MISFIYEANAQAYVKFTNPPKMELKVARRFHNYGISYKSLSKSTIYLELKKGDKLVGNGIYDIAKAGEKQIMLNLSIFKGISGPKPGNDYSYNLYMYEGGRNDWSKKACKTVIIKNVLVMDKNTRKTISVNSFN